MQNIQQRKALQCVRSNKKETKTLIICLKNTKEFFKCSKRQQMHKLPHSYLQTCISTLNHYRKIRFKMKNICTIIAVLLRNVSLAFTVLLGKLTYLITHIVQKASQEPVILLLSPMSEKKFENSLMQYTLPVKRKKKTF